MPEGRMRGSAMRGGNEPKVVRAVSSEKSRMKPRNGCGTNYVGDD